MGEQMQEIVDRRGSCSPPAKCRFRQRLDPHRPPYPSETTERRRDAPKRIWVGIVDDYATVGD